MKNFDQHWMQQALELAKQAEKNGEVPVGAIIIRDEKIIGQGHNQPIQHTDPTAHAEILALREAAKKIGNYRLLSTTLYVTLEPCAMCVGAILHARVARVVFGAADPRAGALVSVFQLADETKLNHRLQYEGGILAEKCSTLLKTFFREKRKI